MIAAWPESLPAPAVDHRGETSSGRLDANEALWPVAVRSYTEELESLSFVFDAAQMATFRDWVDLTVNGGVVWWESTWLSLLGLDGDHAARLASPYVCAMLGVGYWRVDMTVELLRVPSPDITLTYSAGDSDVYFADPGGNYLSIALSGYPAGFQFTVAVTGNGAVGFSKIGLDAVLASGQKQDFYFDGNFWR